MPQRFITLDLDDASIRMLETVGTEVRRWAGATLEPGLVVEGLVVDPEGLGAQIQQLLRRGGFHSKTVLSSLGAPQARQDRWRSCTCRGSR